MDRKVNITMINNIKIIQADKVVCSKEWSWNSDDNGWTGYHFWYVKGGTGRIDVAGEQYDIYGGDCFCFNLADNHICTHNPENPLIVYTVYFQIEAEVKFPIQRIIRNNKLLGESLETCIETYAHKDSELAVMWLMPIIGTFQRENKENTAENEKIKEICRMAENNMEQQVSLKQLAEAAGYSGNQIIRLFKKEYGQTPMQYITQMKMEQAKKMMLYSSMSVTEIAYSVGYTDISYFSKVFKAYVGSNPRSYRKSIISNENAGGQGDSEFLSTGSK